jgi:hypothetical protein
MATAHLVPRRRSDAIQAENWPKHDPAGPGHDRRPAPPLTVLRFPGVSQPTPLAPALPAVARLDYVAIAASIGVAVSSLEALGQGLTQTAAAFRGGDIRNANGRLLQVASGLRLLSTLADVAAKASGLELATLGSSGRLDDLGRALDELTGRQFNEDWAGVADVLVHTLLPALSGWREVFTEILIHADGRFRQPRAS